MFLVVIRFFYSEKYQRCLQIHVNAFGLLLLHFARTKRNNEIRLLKVVIQNHGQYWHGPLILWRIHEFSNNTWVIWREIDLLWNCDDPCYL